MGHSLSGLLWGGELGVYAEFSGTACVDGSDEQYRGHLLSVGTGDSRMGCLKVHPLDTNPKLDLCICSHGEMPPHPVLVAIGSGYLIISYVVVFLMSLQG